MATLRWDLETVDMTPTGTITYITPRASVILTKSDGTEIKLKRGDCISFPLQGANRPPQTCKVADFRFGGTAQPRSIFCTRWRDGAWGFSRYEITDYDNVTKIDCPSENSASAASSAGASSAGASSAAASNESSTYSVPPKPVNANTVDLAKIMEAIKDNRINDLEYLLRTGSNVTGPNGAKALALAASIPNIAMYGMLRRYGAKSSSGGSMHPSGESMRKHSRKRSQRRRKTSRRTRRRH